MKELMYLERLEQIEEAKKIFESQFSARLDLVKVYCPLFVKADSGLQDALSGIEKAVSFTGSGDEFEVVHSLAKWKRFALGKYEFPLYKGLYTDMKAIRKDEKIDDIHSIYVEQYDWEKVISESDRKIEYLKDSVRSIYKAIRQTSIILKSKYKYLDADLPKTISFVTTQELEDMYPDKTSKEREYLITKKHKAVFIMGIGDKLKSGKKHDMRSPDYDDWKLDGDIFLYDKKYDRALEISSMGIRVDEKTLMEQLEKSDCLDRKDLQYHQMILKKELPYTIGGGIGSSRLLMFLLGKQHIAEVQVSSWPTGVEDQLKSIKIL